MFRRHGQITNARVRELDQRVDSNGVPEDPYVWIARQITTARPHELAVLYLMREDETQRRAIELAVELQHVRWVRIGVVVALTTSVLSSVVAVVAIVAN